MKKAKEHIAVPVHIDFPVERPTDPVELFHWLRAHPKLADEMLRAYRKARRQALREAQRNDAKKNPRTKAATRNHKVS